MFKLWVDLWRNVFNFTGKIKAKDYWKSILMNVIAMYAFVLPIGLIARVIPDFGMYIAYLYIGVSSLPLFSLYFRRANDVCWKKLTTLYVAIALPLVSAVLIGILPSRAENEEWPKESSLVWKILALCFALCFYGGMCGLILYDDPTAFEYLVFAGLIIGTLTFVVVGIKNKYKNRNI